MTQSDAEALKWHRNAAEQENPAEQAYLAEMYENGKGGLKKNAGEALKLYRLAAAQGESYAQDALTSSPEP